MKEGCPARLLAFRPEPLVSVNLVAPPDTLTGTDEESSRSEAGAEKASRD